MKTFAACALIAAAFLMTSADAAAPAGAPAGSMGLCKDGSYSTAAEKKGACRGHQGVKDWYGDAAAATAAPATSERAPTPPVSAATTTAAPMAKPATAPTAVAGRTSGTPAEQPVPGGGPGQVWANTSTKVYHCQGDKYYGTTKHGAYMSEADAKAKGYHGDHGKACA